MNISAICPGESLRIIYYESKDLLLTSIEKSRFVVDEDSRKIVKHLITSNEIMLRYNIGMTINSDKYGAPNNIFKEKYTIFINITNVEIMHKKSILLTKVNVNDLVDAVLLHELAHVKYGSFNNNDKKNVISSDILTKELFNILEDSRIEYKMSKEFPEYSFLLNCLLLALKNYVEFDNSFKNKKNGEFIDGKAYQEEKEYRELNDKITILYNFTRFNVLKKKDIEKYSEFIEHMVPMSLVSRRNEIQDIYLAVNALKKLLIKDMISYSDMATEKIEQKIAVSQEELDELLEEADESFKAEIENKVNMESFEENYEEYKSSIGRNDSDGNIERYKSGFFLETCKKRKKEIANLNRTFKLIFTKMMNVPTVEGELNLGKQQQAYIDSLVGDESKTYFVPKEQKVGFDLILLRDISGSTDSFKEKYAEAIVIFLAAIEGIKEVRTAQIDFTTQAFVNKTFDSKIDTATINPVATGGTSLTQAIEKALEMECKNKRKIMVIFSDGDYGNCKYHEDKAKEKFEVIKFAVGGYSNPNNGFYSVDIKDIPTKLFEAIMRGKLK